jgi:hypothetical protein
LLSASETFEKCSILPVEAKRRSRYRGPVERNRTYRDVERGKKILDKNKELELGYKLIN